MQLVIAKRNERSTRFAARIVDRSERNLLELAIEVPVA